MPEQEERICDFCHQEAASTFIGPVEGKSNLWIGPFCAREILPKVIAGATADLRPISCDLTLHGFRKKIAARVTATMMEIWDALSTRELQAMRKKRANEGEKEQ